MNGGPRMVSRERSASPSATAARIRGVPVDGDPGHVLRSCFEFLIELMADIGRIARLLELKGILFYNSATWVEGVIVARTRWGV